MNNLDNYKEIKVVSPFGDTTIVATPHTTAKDIINILIVRFKLPTNIKYELDILTDPSDNTAVPIDNLDILLRDIEYNRFVFTDVGYAV